MVWFNYEREQKQFVTETVGKLPKRWGDDVAKTHGAMMEAGGVRVANEYLREVVEGLPAFVDIGLDDDGVKALAGDVAKRVRVLFADCAKPALALIRESKHKSEISCIRDNVKKQDLRAFDGARLLCERYAVRFPFEHDRAQQQARLVDDTWWLRGLRNSHAKAREACARDAGIVHKKKDVYVSDDTLERRRQQLNRNARLLDGVEMVNEDGEIMKLSDIAKAGMANANNRRAELMTRVTGFEALANKYGHKAVFVTLTCPSRMHATLTSGKVNPKYDGTVPSDAQKYLVHCWAKARALLAKHDVRFYGLRVAEPHHDGTPHWHLILFYDGKPSTLKNLKWFITQKFIETDREELARDISPRVKYVEINPSKGTASGYVVKYVAKNIGGIDGELSDEAGVDSVTLADRVEAWASTWRIRQFQQVGGHVVGVWRELRRVDESELEGKRPAFVKLWQSAQKVAEKKANFAEYIEAMGGLERTPRESQFLIDHDAVTKRGRYGETVVLMPLGVGERFGREVVRNNRKEWVRL